MSRKKEGKVELYLKKRVEAMGGACLKMQCLSWDGYPDRHLIIPKPGYLSLRVDVETKTSVGRLSPAQKIAHGELQKVGAPPYVCSTRDEVDRLLDYFARLGYGGQ